MRCWRYAISRKTCSHTSLEIAVVCEHRDARSFHLKSRKGLAFHEGAEYQQRWISALEETARRTTAFF
jgi:hypothetical protein